MKGTFDVSNRKSGCAGDFGDTDGDVGLRNFIRDIRNRGPLTSDDTTCSSWSRDSVNVGIIGMIVKDPGSDMKTRWFTGWYE